MFTKLVKHDIHFSKTSFFSAAICLIAISIVGRIIFPFIPSQEQAFNVMAMINLGGFGIFFLAAFSQTLQSFKDGLFGDMGYLAMTLPIRRGKLLLAKLATTAIWFHFMAIMIIAAFLILEGTQRPDWLTNEIQPMVTPSRVIAIYVESLSIIFATVGTIYLLTTLSHSFFGRVRIPGFVSAILGIAAFWTYIIGVATLRNRYYEWVQSEIERFVTDQWIFENAQPEVIEAGGAWITSLRTTQEFQVGLNYGRIPIGYLHIDMYMFLANAAIGVAALAITYYLLKKHVSFQ